MKSKILLLLIALIFSVSFGTNTLAATTPVASNTQTIPPNVKTLDDLLNHLISNGVIKNMEDARNYMENNKQVILNIKPNIIDFGYTVRLYEEINSAARKDGLIKLVYGNKEVQQWTIPVVVMNHDSQPQEISKENFALVPNLLPKDNELYVLALDAEYITDDSSGKILDKVTIQPDKEVYLNVTFYVSPMTFIQNVKLRMYDGKDHTDIKITK